MSNYATNKKAHFDYELLDTFEAGLVLLGTEVKAVRAGRARLDGSYVQIQGGAAFLLGASIPPFQIPNAPRDYVPDRVRTLLLSQKQIAALQRSLHTAGLTVIPLSLYNAGRNIKLKIALARGKKKADKRESIKARDTKRDIERTLKSQ